MRVRRPDSGRPDFRRPDGRKVTMRELKIHGRGSWTRWYRDWASGCAL
jgi:hypothetical protein